MAVPSKERLALLWHLSEALLVLSLIGVAWSLYHEHGRLAEVSRERAQWKELARS